MSRINPQQHHYISYYCTTVLLLLLLLHYCQYHYHHSTSTTTTTAVCTAYQQASVTLIHTSQQALTDAELLHRIVLVGLRAATINSNNT